MTVALRPARARRRRRPATSTDLAAAGVHRDPAAHDPIATGSFAQRLVHKASAVLSGGTSTPPVVPHPHRGRRLRPRRQPARLHPQAGHRLRRRVRHLQRRLDRVLLHDQRRPQLLPAGQLRRRLVEGRQRRLLLRRGPLHHRLQRHLPHPVLVPLRRRRRATAAAPAATSSATASATSRSPATARSSAGSPPAPRRGATTRRAPPPAPPTTAPSTHGAPCLTTDCDTAIARKYDAARRHLRLPRRRRIGREAAARRRGRWPPTPLPERRHLLDAPPRRPRGPRLAVPRVRPCRAATPAASATPPPTRVTHRRRHPLRQHLRAGPDLLHHPATAAAVPTSGVFHTK